MAQQQQPQRTLTATLALVGLMTVLGAAALGTVGWLMQARMSQPVARAAPPVGTAGDAGSLDRLQPAVPPGTLSDGLREDLWAAREALAGGRRADATAALDAARRLTEVARHGTGGAEPAFERLSLLVRRARHALQNGRPAEAGEVLEGAALLAATGPLSRYLPDEPSRYAGATVLNSRGRPIGEVESVGRGEARLRLGGWQDFMGVIDLGGDVVQVPIGRLVFGPSPWLGRHEVVLEEHGQPTAMLPAAAPAIGRTTARR